MSKRRHLVRLLFIASGILCLSPAPFAHGKSGTPIPFHLKQQDPGRKLSPSAISEQVESLIFQESNQERSAKKLQALADEDVLVKTARDHAYDMLKRNYLSHFSPEKKSVVDRLKKYQPKIERAVGENLHTISSSQGLIDPKAVADQMLEDWMRSTSHRKNILSKSFAYLGVGCASDGDRIFCVQVFAGPYPRPR